MKKRYLAISGVVSLLLSLAAILVSMGSSATAAGAGLRTRLEGFQETPLTLSTPATGEFKARIAGDEMSMSYELTFSGLEGTVTQAHIHFGQRATTGGIIAWLCQTAAVPGPAGQDIPTCPAGGGTVTGTITPAKVIGPAGQGIAPGEFAEVVRAARAGYVYANVHSTLRPSGEIRGQVEN